MARGTILLVDDEEDIVNFFQDYLEELGFNIVIAEDGEAGLKAFQEGTFDLVISDMMMPKMIGVEFLRHVKEIKPEQKLIFMTGVKEESIVKKAKDLGCYTYLTKPVTLSEVDEKIKELFPDEEAE